MSPRRLTKLELALLVVGICSLWASPVLAKAVTEADLVALINLGIDEQAVVAKITKDGVDFAADEAVLKRLEAAGASSTILDAVRAAGAKAAKPAAASAVTYADVLKLVELRVDEAAILARLEKSPTIFTLDVQQVAELKQAGASQKLLDALQGQRAASQPAGDVSDIAILLDCSGSMQEKTPDGQTKMTVAKRVLADLVQKIPDGLRLTFIVYGHDRQQECQAVKIVRSLEEIDASGKSQLAQAIGQLQPAGATPIALALRTAGSELAKNDAYCGLVLISDGKETCKGDPAAEAETLASRLKLSFGVNVIGFDVGQDRAALEEIAQRGKGRYFNADSAAELNDAVQKLRTELEQQVAPQLQQRETRRFAAAGQAVQPGAFLNDAALIEPGEYKGSLAFLEAHYYQLPVRAGQELRAVGIIQKTPYSGYNKVQNETFAVTIYRQNLEVAARELVTVTGNPTAPASVRATWTADYDGMAYIAISASDNHDSKEGYGEPIEVYEPKQPEPSAYTLRVRREGAATAGSMPVLQAQAGNGFESAGQLTLPGIVPADLKLGEVIFYRLQATKGDSLLLSLAAQKPWHQGYNRATKFRYTMTVYDDDQVQVAQKSLEVQHNPPDAHSLVADYTVELSGNVYVSIGCENAGQKVYLPKEGPGPGRVAVQVTGGSAQAADENNNQNR